MRSGLAHSASVLGLTLTLAGCVAKPPAGQGLALMVHEQQRWQVLHAGQPIGELILLELQDQAGTQRFYRVENRAAQWLGFVSETGGVYRRVPFQEHEAFVGVYPMAQGLAWLYDVDQVAIGPAGGAAREASAPRDGTAPAGKDPR